MIAAPVFGKDYANNGIAMEGPAARSNYQELFKDVGN